MVGSIGARSAVAIAVASFIVIISYSSACFSVLRTVAVSAEQAAHLACSGSRDRKQGFRELRCHWKPPSTETSNVLAALTLFMVGISSCRRRAITSVDRLASKARWSSEGVAMAAFAPSRQQRAHRLCGASASVMMRDHQRQLDILKQCLAPGAEKPEVTTLYTKAGSDGESIGDCPFFACGSDGIESERRGIPSRALHPRHKAPVAC